MIGNLHLVTECNQILEIIDRELGMKKFMELSGMKRTTILRYLQYSRFEDMPQRAQLTFQKVLSEKLIYMSEESQLSSILVMIDNNLDKYKDDVDLFQKLMNLANKVNNRDLLIYAEFLCIANMAYINKVAAISAFNDLISRMNNSDTHHLINAYRELGFIHYSLGQYENCSEVLKRARRICNGYDDRELCGRVFHLSGLNNFARGYYDDSEKDFRTAMKYFEGNKYKACLLRALIGNTQNRIDVNKARRTLGKALECALELGDSYLLAIIYNNLYDSYEDNEGMSNVMTSKALEYAVKSGVTKSIQYARNNLINYSIKFGKVNETIINYLSDSSHVLELSITDAKDSVNRLLKTISESSDTDLYLSYLKNGIINLMVDESKNVENMDKLESYYGKVSSYHLIHEKKVK